MKSGATESSFYYLNQYYSFPNNVEVSRSIEVLAQSNKQYKILWAHDNCDQPQLLRLPELVSQIDLIVCVSNWEAEQYIKYNRAPAEKIVVIPNGVADIFHLKSPKSKTAIYFSGPHKGITPLPKIWKQVIKNHPDAKLKVFSSHNLYGEQYEQHFKIPEHLEAIEELKSLPGVEYSPCIDREQLLPHIQDAAFFVHPNVWEETFCVSMAEAMVCGCYPITSDIGALREVSFNRGKYIPMTGKNTPVGWEPSPKFINEFAQELSRCFEFFDKEPQTFYAATKELSQITKETYDWKKIAVVWSKLIYQVSEEKGFDESYTNNQYEIDKFSQDDVVIDIGAHRGFFSKLCLDKGCKEIHCFEPEPKNYECLIDNLKSYQNFRGYNLAVSNKNGEKDFFIFSGINTGLHSFYPNKEKGFLNSFDIGTKIKVKTVSLDDILNNFSKVALIKVDAEGSEFDILMNSKLLFKVNKIVGEYHNDLTDKKSKDLFEYLEKNNFTITKVDEQKGIFTAEKNKIIEVKSRPRYYCMTTMQSSEKYTHYALDTFFRNSIFGKQDKFFLIDNDKTFPKDCDNVTVVSNASSKSFAENMNFILKQAIMDGADFVGLSNDIIFTKNWNQNLGDLNSVSIPLCNQHLHGDWIKGEMELEEFIGKEELLNQIASQITSQPQSVAPNLIKAFYCFYVPYEVSSKVGLLDEEFGKGGGEDIDYGLRAEQLGFETKFNHHSYLLHFSHKTLDHETKEEKDKRTEQLYLHFCKKWGKEVADRKLSLAVIRRFS